MSKPNFRIIEGGYDDVDFEEFKKDYMDMRVSKSDILKKYDLNHNKYLRYGNQVYKETGFKRRRGVNALLKPMQYIRCEKNGKYAIYKQIHGKKKYFGTWESLDDAKQIRNYLVEHKWTDTAINNVIDGNVL